MNTTVEIRETPGKLTKETLQPAIDKPSLIGYLLLVASLSIFILIEDVISSNNNEAFTFFVIHYLLAVTYAIFLLVNDSYGVRKSWRKKNIGKTVILLNLFLISSFALNRELIIFESSVDWLRVYIFVTSLTTLSFQYSDKLPLWANKIQHLMLGSAIVLYTYQAIFVLNVYGVGAIGIVFFGIGAHIFVPITFLVACVFLVKYQFRKTGYRWLVAGSLITILYGTAFVKEWNKRVRKIETLANQSVLHLGSELPLWVRVGQSLPSDWITQRILRSDLVYSTYRKRGGDWGFTRGSGAWNETRRHDPFVFISTLFSECNLSREDRIRIIQAISGSRHNAEERLWSGQNLSTSYIVSDIDIYPDHRLAYTEKYLNIKNSGKKSMWGNTQEAIYTFQLPEGSVITSLSLWVNGKEEKGILTSKQKAGEAYETIVGKERRDPSVIHWQEGNTVTVRVFPCTPEEERKVKIGITSPLSKHDDKILYQNIAFEGPDPTGARETIRVRIVGSDQKFEMPTQFKLDNEGDYISEDSYDPDFELSFNEVPLKANNRFVFDGFEYSIREIEEDYKSFIAKDIYIDINNSWKQAELDAFEKMSDDKNIFIYNENGFIKLGPDNWEPLTDDLRKKNFSLFPFHLLTDTDHSLIVTKGNSWSPHLKDFKESNFAIGLANFFVSGKKVTVYNIEEDIPVYLRSLREFRAFTFAAGNLDRLTSLLSENKFPVILEDEGTVVLYDSKMSISKQKASGMTSNAPDHLARLFAYNNIMKKVGANYFKEDFIDEDLVEEASAAYVVSPASSLIVLETKEDYERFNIEDSKDSLKNASKLSSGAVPEPHEWALIGLFALFVFVLKFRGIKSFMG